MEENEKSTLRSLELSKRDAKALKLVLDGKVKLYKKGGGEIRKPEEDKLYVVTDDFCSCPDYQFNGSVCKHRRAYRLAREIERMNDEHLKNGGEFKEYVEVIE